MEVRAPGQKVVLCLLVLLSFCPEAFDGWQRFKHGMAGNCF